jgi:hypothetical protein
MCLHFLFPVVDKSGTSCQLVSSWQHGWWGQQTDNKLFQQVWYRNKLLVYRVKNGLGQNVEVEYLSDRSFQLTK